MKKFGLFLALLLAFSAVTFASAQSFSTIGATTIDHLGGRVVPCSSIEYVRDVVSTERWSSCGIIQDTLTSINQSWTTEHLESLYGMMTTTDWTYVDRTGGVTLYMAGYYHPRYNTILMLFVMPSIDASVIVLTGNPY